MYPEAMITDISVIFGNSGAPLINKKGEVLGMVSFYLNPNLTFSGGVAQVILEQIVCEIIRTQQDYVKGFMGLSPIPMNNFVIFRFGLLPMLPQPTGYFISEIAENGPFKDHSEVVGDILLKINGKPVGINYQQSNPSFFSWRCKPGTKLVCKFRTAGKIIITLDPFPPVLDTHLTFSGGPFFIPNDPGIGGVAATTRPSLNEKAMDEIANSEAVKKLKANLAKSSS